MANKILLPPELNTETVDTWPAIMLAYPFVRSGMTPEEYLKEKEYYNLHSNEVSSGKYTPLWKQNI